MEATSYLDSLQKGSTNLRQAHDNELLAQQNAQRLLTADQVAAVLARYEPQFKTQRIRDASTWNTIQDALHAHTHHAWALDRMLDDELEPRVIRTATGTISLTTGSKYPPFPRLCAYDADALPQARAENTSSFTDISHMTAVDAAAQYGMSLMSCDSYRILIDMHPHFEISRGENFSCWLATDLESRLKNVANEGTNENGTARISQMYAHTVDLTRGWRGELPLV